MAATLRTYLELVRFSHTIFALPFAVMAAVLALVLPGAPALPPAEWARRAVGVILCMVTARTAAMAFNRLVDRAIDADNPRTAGRHLPRGAVGVEEVFALVVASSAGFVGSTLLFLPNWLPVVLSIPVLAWLLAYSYAKRFTLLAHAWLGAALGMAPVAAWLAIRGETVLADPADLLPAAVLGIAVTAWVTGFDCIYACQDARFDAARGLHSIPSRLGVPRALRVAALLHLAALGALALLPAFVPPLGAVYWGALAAIGALLLWEHSIVSPDDLSRVDQAFFTANAAIGLVLLAAILVDVLW